MSASTTSRDAATSLADFRTDILDALPFPLLLLSADHHRIRYVNGQGEHLLGASRNQLLGTDAATLFYPSTPITDLLTHAAQTEHGASAADVSLATSAEDHLHADLHAAFLNNGNETGQAPGIVVLSIHPRGKLMAAKNFSGHEKSTEIMSNVLAHEIKNPLASIRGAAQLLEKSGSEKERKLTQLICNEVERVRRLVDSMEAFSNTLPIAKQALNIHEVLRYAMEVVQKLSPSPVEFVEEYDPSLPEIEGNRELLIQLFINLFNNACEAMEEQGKAAIIRLTTCYQNHYRSVGQGESGQPHRLPVQVLVCDNGPGIPSELLSSIFEPFVTSKPQGKGLGLAIIAKIVQQHGAIITTRNLPSGGACFELSLPASR